jgi:hypothetical protein
MRDVKVLKAIKGDSWRIVYDEEEGEYLNGLKKLLDLLVPVSKHTCYILFSDKTFPEHGLGLLTFTGSGRRNQEENVALYVYKDQFKKEWSIKVPFKLLERGKEIPKEIYFKIITI